MRSFATVLALFAAATTVLAVPNLHVARQDVNTAIPTGTVAGDNSYSAIPDLTASDVAPAEKRLTNAERLARGLQPAAPRRRHDNMLARDPLPSAAAVSRRAKVKVTDAFGKQLGYLTSRAFKNIAETYKPSAADVGSSDDALIVSFTMPAGVTTANFLNLHLENSNMPKSSPFLALIQSVDGSDANIGTGTSKYVALGASAQTPAGSPPVTVANSFHRFKAGLTAESAIWSVDLGSKQLIGQYFNTDGSAPLTTLVAQDQFIYATSEPALLGAKYPGSSVDQIKFEVVIL